MIGLIGAAAPPPVVGERSGAPGIVVAHPGDTGASPIVMARPRMLKRSLATLMPVPHLWFKRRGPAYLRRLWARFSPVPLGKPLERAVVSTSRSQTRAQRLSSIQRLPLMRALDRYVLLHIHQYSSQPQNVLFQPLPNVSHFNKSSVISFFPVFPKSKIGL